MQPKVVVSLTRSLTDAIVISVEDNGPGVQQPSKIFRAFRSSKVHGVGLGLHVSRKIIEAHRGALLTSNNSALGGAKFEIHLPIAEEASGGVSI